MVCVVRTRGSSFTYATGGGYVIWLELRTFNVVINQKKNIHHYTVS